MPAFNFQSRFAPLVESGRKKTTIRGREVKVGSTAYLFTGQRTRACVRLGQGEIVSCTPIKLGYKDNGRPRAKLGSMELIWHDFEELAKGDGFARPREMVEWFETQYKQRQATGDGGADVYSGFLIAWK